jgi:hypothetical protein
LLHASFLLGFLLDPEDGDDMFLRKVGWLATEYTALYSCLITTAVWSSNPTKWSVFVECLTNSKTNHVWRVASAEMRHRVGRWTFTDVREDLPPPSSRLKTCQVGDGEAVNWAVYSLLMFCLVYLWTWTWRKYIPSKHKWTSIGLYSVTFQRRVLFIVTAAMTSNPNELYLSSI